MIISERHKKACELIECHCIEAGMNEFSAHGPLHNALVKIFNRLECAEERAARAEELVWKPISGESVG
jgi:hypothetical protein